MTNVFGEREKKGITNALFKMYSIIFKVGASTNCENTYTVYTEGERERKCAL